jgi:hypothetical protein
MTAAVFSSYSPCKGAKLWFFLLFSSASILLYVTIFVSSPLSLCLLPFWFVLLRFLSSLSPLFAPVLSSPSIADGVLPSHDGSAIVGSADGGRMAVVPGGEARFFFFSLQRP